MCEWVAIDGLILTAVNTKIRLTVAVQIKLAQRNAVVDRFLEDSCSHRISVPRHLPGKPGVQRNQLHGDDFSPQSMQPVIHLNEDGERQIEMMRWAFKLTDRPRPLFNARSEGIEHAKFWKDAFLKGRCIVPGNAIYEWQEAEKGKTKPKYEFDIPGQEPFAMAGVWFGCGETPRQDYGRRHSPFSLARPMN